MNSYKPKRVVGTVLVLLAIFVARPVLAQDIRTTDDTADTIVTDIYWGIVSDLTTVMENVVQPITEDRLAEVYAIERRTARLALLLNLAGLSVAAGVAFLVIRQLSGGTARLIGATRQLASGDLSVKIESHSGDEIGRLSEHFDGVAKGLRDIVVNIQETASRTDRITDALATSTSTTETSFHDIAGNLETINKQFSELDERIAAASTDLGQIAEAIARLNERIEDQTAAATESTAAVEQMMASLANVADITEARRRATESLVETAADGGRKLDGTNDVIRSITNDVDGLQEMIGIIDAVAAQTNLLAMNAAIEAAHAGDYGRGFGVIATEIRNLAENTSDNARKMKDVLTRVVDKIGQADTSGSQTGAAFREIDREIRGVADALVEISNNAGELSAGGGQVLDAMTSLSNSQSEIREHSQEIRSRTTAVTTGVTDVRTISADVLDKVQHIEEQVGAAVGTVKDLVAARDEIARAIGTLTEQAARFRTESVGHGDGVVEVGPPIGQPSARDNDNGEHVSMVRRLLRQS